MFRGSGRETFMGRELEETEPHRIKNAQRQKPSRVEVSKTDPHPSASDTWRVLFGPWKLISSSRAPSLGGLGFGFRISGSWVVPALKPNHLPPTLDWRALHQQVHSPRRSGRSIVSNFRTSPTLEAQTGGSGEFGLFTPQSPNVIGPLNRLHKPLNGSGVPFATRMARRRHDI